MSDKDIQAKEYSSKVRLESLMKHEPMPSKLEAIALEAFKSGWKACLKKLEESLPSEP